LSSTISFDELVKNNLDVKTLTATVQTKDRKSIHTKYNDYCKSVFKEGYKMRRKILSNEFWLYIYTQYTLTVDELQDSIKTTEKSAHPLVIDLFEEGKNANHITELYRQLSLFQNSKARSIGSSFG